MWFSWVIACYAFEAALKSYKLCLKLYNVQKSFKLQANLHTCSVIWSNFLLLLRLFCWRWLAVCFSLPIFQIKIGQMSTQNKSATRTKEIKNVDQVIWTGIVYVEFFHWLCMFFCCPFYFFLRFFSSSFSFHECALLNCYMVKLRKWNRNLKRCKCEWIDWFHLTDLATSRDLLPLALYHCRFLRCVCTFFSLLELNVWTTCYLNVIVDQQQQWFYQWLIFIIR